MKAEHILIAVFLCFMQPAWGQFTDDFSDGNLDGWSGDVANFIVNPNQELQLNAPSGSTLSWIHVPVVFQDSMVWEFDFKLDFAPSTSNQLRIWLALNSTDLPEADGYHLQIGATGDTDALELYFVNNGSPAPIGQSVDGLVANEPVEMTLRVVKRDNGNWEIYRLGTIPELLFTAFHNVIPLSQMNTFGFEAEYTETRRDKFYFDNVEIHEPQPDVTAPTLLSLQVLDENSVELSFDEPIETSSANTLTHYVLTPGNLNPSSIGLNGNIITLDFANNFISLQPYILQISGLKDDAGNTIQNTSEEFTYLQIDIAGPNELLITEIMADPTPVISLPDAEYVEILNYSSKVLRLSDYVIKVGSGERDLPDEVINPMEYVILASEEDAILFQSYGRVVIIDLPALTNSGATISISDQQGNVLHEISYTLDWYHDSEKSDGGWSLEMINPENICATQTNWAASENLSGGTPGQENSQWTIVPDVTGPEVVSLIVTSPQTIEIRFNEKVDLNLMSNLDNYTILPVNSVDAVSLVNPTTIQLHLLVPLDEFLVFSIPSFLAYDCLGNEQATPGAIEFGIRKDAAPGELLINEVLFNPATGGSRFLEIINTTNRFINLQTLVIARLSSSDQDFYPVEVNEVLSPFKIAAFTPDRNDILSRYTVPNPNVLYTSDLPSWDEDADNVSLLVNGEVIDSFTYSSDWHHPVLADQNGVSLERVSISAGSTLASNWHSASSVSGGATPTGPNSQMVVSGTPGDTPYTISTRNFSPNDDGYKDFFAMEFNGGSPDDITSVWVYDREGREVIQLLSNEIVGSQALVTWDGRTSDQALSTMGIYILLVRVWNAAGDVEEYQESFALIER